MKHPFALLVMLSLGSAALFASVAAQDGAPELDLAAIRERAKQHSGDAEALAASVRQRAETLTEGAKTTQTNAQTNQAAYASQIGTAVSGDVLDFDAMVRDQAAAEKAVLGNSPRFIAFASLSMPDAALKALVRDMGRAGGVTVLRGFPAGDAQAFKKKLATIWSDGSEASSIGIDPRLFRAFDIQAAPSFVLLASDFTPCDGFDCRSELPPHDRTSGNISVARVLETFADGRGPGAALARLHLKSLNDGGRP